jgi:hypothetical protein
MRGEVGRPRPRHVPPTSHAGNVARRLPNAEMRGRTAYRTICLVSAAYRPHVVRVLLKLQATQRGEFCRLPTCQSGWLSVHVKHDEPALFRHSVAVNGCC